MRLKKIDNVLALFFLYLFLLTIKKMNFCRINMDIKVQHLVVQTYIVHYL
jgi:hypothetical protein